MMLALDPKYVVTAYYSTDMFKSIMKVGTLMVTVRKKIERKHKEVHNESCLDKIKKMLNFKN